MKIETRANTHISNPVTIIKFEERLIIIDPTILSHEISLKKKKKKKREKTMNHDRRNEREDNYLKKGNCYQTIIKMAREHMQKKEFAYDL
jgi:hypothetical protein